MGMTIRSAFETGNHREGLYEARRLPQIYCVAARCIDSFLTGK